MSTAHKNLGWSLAIATPVLLWCAWRFIPYPGTLLAAGALLGGYTGFLLYEHAFYRTRLERRVVIEQITLAALLLVLFSFSL